MSHAKENRFWIIFLIITLLFMLFTVFAYFAMRSQKQWGEYSKKSNDIIFEGKVDNSIGVILVEGAIMSAKQTIEHLLVAEKNKDIKAIIIRINSPGGAVGPSQEIYEEIKRIDAKKPVYASMETLAASGGYYIAAAARHIFANAGTLTGSIGVISQFMNLSKLYDFLKLKQKTIKSGKYKDLGNPNREMNEEEQALFQGMSDSIHAQFKRDILKRRKAKIKGNADDLFQGQIYSGEEAQKLGLVDEIGSLWQASRKIHKELKMPGKVNLIYIKKKKKSNLMRYLEETGSAFSFIRSLFNLEKAPALFL